MTLVERLEAYARRCSIEMMKLSGGGSEMFERIGEEFYAEPELCRERAEHRLEAARKMQAHTIERLQQRVEVLEGALRPFAEAADYYNEKFSDWGGSEGPYTDTMVAGPAGIKVSHYRQARAALSEGR